MKVWIIWVANAGKSSLFNRLVWSHRAIITDIPGTTRELLRDHAKLHGMWYELVDSPGLYHFDEDKPFIEQIIKEADVFVFVHNTREWLTANSKTIADMIRRAGKSAQTMLLLNKVDNADEYNTPQIMMSEYTSLGIEHMVLGSTQHGYGMEATIDRITDHPGKQLPGGVEHIQVAIVGKPNNGKSTLINKLCKTMVAHVSDVAGTTLDYLMGEFARWGQAWRIYDTAGIRRKGKIHGLERIALEKTRSMIKFIKPIVFLMVDSSEWWTNGDMTLLGEMIEMAVPCIVVLNKADLLDKIQLEELMITTKKLLTWAPWIPTTTISARDEIGIEKVMKIAKKIHEWRDQRISTHKLNDTLKKAWLANPPRFPKNKVCKFYYATQVEVRPLTIVLFINDIGKANYAFTRWVQNVMRAAFGLDGVPINIKFKDKEEDGQKWESKEAWNERLRLRDEEQNADEDKETEMQQEDKKKRAKSSDTDKPLRSPRNSKSVWVVKTSSSLPKPKMVIVKDEEATESTDTAQTWRAKVKPTRKDGHPLRRTRLAKKADKNKAFVQVKRDEKQTAIHARKKETLRAKRAKKK